MKNRKRPVTYDTRFRHKLNMLEPGTVMLKWVGIFLLLGVVMRLVRRELAAVISFGFAGALLLLLVILLAVEAHQDNVLNAIAAREQKEQESLHLHSEVHQNEKDKHDET